MMVVNAIKIELEYIFITPINMVIDYYDLLGVVDRDIICHLFWGETKTENTEEWPLLIVYCTSLDKM